MPRGYRRSLVALAVCSVLIAPAVPVLAGPPPTIVVTTTLDRTNTGATCGKPCSLRAAILTAPAGAKISVPAGFYHLSSTLGTLSINESLTIAGAGAGKTTIAGNIDGQTAPFNNSVFFIDTSGVATLRGLTISGGHTSSDGGGIDNSNGSLKLIGCVVTNNLADGNGGGIHNAGTLSLVSSRVSNNTATSGGGGGGGIDNRAQLTAMKSIIDHNLVQSAGTTFGGGLINQGVGTTATLIASSVTNNTTGSNGGGVDSFGGATLTLKRSVVSGNSAGFLGGGIFSASTTNIGKSTISDNSAGSTSGHEGGGLYINGGTTNVLRSTFSNNSSGDGGAIFAGTSSTLTVTNSTISSNAAGDQSGGGISNSAGTVTILFTTIAGNTAPTEGGGIWAGGGTTFLEASLVTDNSGGIDPDCWTTGVNLVSHAFNVLQTVSADCPASVFNGPHDRTGTDPNIRALAFNGGPTETHAIPSNSIAAKNAAGDPNCNGHFTDQRGVLRPAHACDSGAFQVTQ